MFYEGMRVWWEGGEGSDSNQAKAKGGSAKEGPHVRGGSELGSYEDPRRFARAAALLGTQ